ncbi:MAG TPA: cellobiose phosphorylase [Anaerolineae bacterium]|nr:cellobiose phosphorylase [Anaerolineae bacterium]
MSKTDVTGWHFIDDERTFVLEAPHKTNYLYFPLVNEAGMMSVVTPLLHGDAKTGQNTFVMTPVSVEDLHNTRSARNFWVYIHGVGPWSATGNSAPQIAQTFADDAETVTLEGGFLWQRVTRENVRLGLRAAITSLVPASADTVELLQVTLTNTGTAPLTFTPTAAIPLYGRSADNLRDHRHVTSLLHRIRTHTHGVLVRPTLSFDERGHQPNTVTYGVLGAEDNGDAPVCFYPVVEDFIGEGGTLEWPQAVVAPEEAKPGVPAGTTVDGYEAIGALRFRDVTLEAGDSVTYVVIIAIMDGVANPDALIASYGNAAAFDHWFEQTRAYWQAKLSPLTFCTADPTFDRWLKWVTVQPILRRLFGNSFLPYHDYGRGGRGWRDLWQDCLALLLMEPADVRELLFSSYAGVRSDGSNATIIGAKPGEFKADRNNIPRVWMDHGAWPLLTTQLYLDATGDLDFLLQEQVYFKDQFINRAQSLDLAWRPEDGTQLKTASGEVYRGTILEHLLIQHLTAFFNVGEHNIIRLEGADWNDGMDMARRRGESVAFTALYAGNLRTLSELVLALRTPDNEKVELAVELIALLDTLSEPVDYADVAAKQARLAAYFAAVHPTVSGEKVTVSLRALADDLAAKADWLTEHLRQQEWIENVEGFGWFNGYYDEDGQRVEGDHPNGVRMTLTGQTFVLLGDVATAEQARAIVAAADRYLYAGNMGGYRLNTDFGEVLLNLGRCFGYAYGHKENGAMFSHMAVMYANALYRRGMVHEGYKVLDTLYRHCCNFAVSRMYPGIPEYVNPRGRGMYPYLTGSASWYLLTLVNEVFGVKGRRGALLLDPKLVAAQFDADGNAGIQTLFADRQLRVVYHNPKRLEYGNYAIETVTLNGAPVSFEHRGHAALLPRTTLLALAEGQTHTLDVHLAAQ